MTKTELYNSIKSRKYYCIICHNVQQEIIRKGVDLLGYYEGTQCPGVIGMIKKYHNVDWEKSYGETETDS